MTKYSNYMLICMTRSPNETGDGNGREIIENFMTEEERKYSGTYRFPYLTTQGKACGGWETRNND